jgi:ABC-2 type transport system permease protein
MSLSGAALRAEALKAWRSRVPWLTALAIALAPLAGGLFMFILQDPARARTLGVISAKAQLTAGTADWPSYFALLAQATAVGGMLVFAIATAWIFAREFSDRTDKELLALPTTRATIVAAKFLVVLVWGAALSVVVIGVGLLVGMLLRLPGWSATILRRGIVDLGAAAGLTLALMPNVALAASAGRGYLPAISWAMLTIFLAQIVAATGWGSWFPWSVPALFSGLAGPRSAQLGVHSYLLVAAAMGAGLAGTFAWWLRADHSH